MLSIPHARPVFGAAYEHAALAVVQSGFLAQGKQTQALEACIKSQLQRRYVIAVDSGTSALMLSIRALFQHQPRRIGIPAYACASLLFAVKAAGAEPVCIDCDDGLCYNQTQVHEICHSLDALIVVHPFGMVDPIITADLPCPIIEDIAQSVGASLSGKAVGTWSNISIGSCYATKPWGGAYGGFITTEDEHIASSIQHMINPDQSDLCQPYVGHHQLSDLHATLAIQRIQHAAQEQKQRQQLQLQYQHIIQTTTATAITSHHDSISNAFRYIIRTPQDADVIIAQLNALGIAARQPVQQPLHHHQQEHNCPHADQAWQHCLSLPMLTDMTEAEFNAVKQGLQQCL